MTGECKAGLILCQRRDFAWAEGLLDIHPLLLRVLGRTLLSHYAEFFTSQGIGDLRILSEFPSRPLENLLVARTAGPRMSLWPLRQEASLVRLLDAQRFFIRAREVLIVSAPSLFPQAFLKAAQPIAFPPASHPGLAPLKLRDSGELEPWDPGPWASLTSARDYFDVSMRLLKTGAPPAYSLKSIPASCRLTPPLFLDRDIRIGSGCELGPETVLGAGTRVGARASLRRSLVYGDVVIGAGLELTDKLVIGRHILSPERGSVSAIEDSRLLRPKKPLDFL